MPDRNLLETLHTALLVYLKVLLLAPDVPQLGGAAGGLRYPGLFTIGAVFRFDGNQWNKAGHLTMPGHLDLSLGTPDGSGRRSLPVWLQFVAMPAATAAGTHNTSRSTNRKRNSGAGQGNDQGVPDPLNIERHPCRKKLDIDVDRILAGAVFFDQYVSDKG